MSNMKIIPLIDRARREAIAESEIEMSALAKDLFAALEAEKAALRAEITQGVGRLLAEIVAPLKVRLERLESEVEQLSQRCGAPPI